MPVGLVAIFPNLMGSVSSCIASAFVLAVHAFLPPKRHFRHALIFNLLVADFLNAANNSISGFVLLARRDRQLKPGAGCTFNGWLGQLTAQTIDFSILAISVVVLRVVRKPNVIKDPPVWKARLLCVAAWIPGIITSFTGLGLQLYQPVSGNWCWVRPSILERYLLMHGWRIAIFCFTIIIYILIHISLYRMYGKLTVDSSHTTGRTDPVNRQTRSFGAVQSEHENITITKSTTIEFQILSSAALASPTMTEGSDGTTATSLPMSPTQVSSPSIPMYSQNSHVRDVSALRKVAIKRMLLLNGYPFLYIILWIPGIVNGMVESVHGDVPQWLASLQATSQFIGLANAITYGWNEAIRQQLVSEWESRKSRRYVQT